MLVYDHFLTFEVCLTCLVVSLCNTNFSQREIEYIWNRKKSIPTYLFLIFRYATPIVSLINLIALHDPNWTGSTCDDWIWLPVSMGPIISAATGGATLFFFEIL